LQDDFATGNRVVVTGRLAGGMGIGNLAFSGHRAWVFRGVNKGACYRYEPDYTRGLTKSRGKSKVRALGVCCGNIARHTMLYAQVVKLVDTLASGASARKGVEVQVLFWAPYD
jgi:hypothetical protein